MPVTLRDVASHLNVSVSLVSQALTDGPSRVSEKTRQRVREAATELGYRPIASARALRSGKSGVIAISYVRTQMGIWGEIADLLAERLGACGNVLAVHVAPDQSGMLGRLRDLVGARACDAIVLCGDEKDTEEQGCLLESLGMPFIVKGRHEACHPHWLQADFDHERMASDVVRIFASRGHRRIAYIGYPDEQEFVGHLRKGYLATMHELFGEPAPEHLIAAVEPDDISASEQMNRWLALPKCDQPTAVAIFAGQPIWRQVELSLQQHGRRLGRWAPDIAAAGEFLAHPLLFGDAEGYNVLPVHLAQELYDRLLEPLLSESFIADPVVRLMPALEPMRSLKLALR